MRVDRLLANLGYGSRREVARFLQNGRITRADGTAVSVDEKVSHAELRFDGAPLDPPAPLTIILHKPTGYTSSTEDAGPIVYELLPPRFSRRNPVLAVAGRLDKTTSGLVILTDDGALLHRIISPRKEIWKTYQATLARALEGDEPKIFASGKLLLRDEKKPCAPARMEPLEDRRVRISITEGRYHQVRRMFAAVGNEVQSLHRSSIGGLTLGDLPEAKWRIADSDDMAALFEPEPG